MAPTSPVFPTLTSVSSLLLGMGILLCGSAMLGPLLAGMVVTFASISILPLLFGTIILTLSLFALWRLLREPAVAPVSVMRDIFHCQGMQGKQLTQACQLLR